MEETEKTKDIEGMSFEQALAELEKIVGTLESGQIPLEESINAYERGMALKRHCEKKLKEAKTKIERINIDKEGNVSTQPFDVQE